MDVIHKNMRTMERIYIVYCRRVNCVFNTKFILGIYGTKEEAEGRIKEYENFPVVVFIRDYAYGDQVTELFS